MSDIREEIHWLLQDAERENILPPAWIAKWGKWDRIKEIIQELIDDNKYADERIEEMAMEYRGKERLLGDIEDEISEVIDMVDAIDATEQSDHDTNEQLQVVMKSLEQIKQRI